MAITKDNIARMPIRKLIKDMIIRSSLLAIIDFRDLILVNPNFTYVDVMESLVRKALSVFERKCPLFKRSRIYVESAGDYTCVNNFEAFLNGVITEEYTMLIPKVIYNLDSSLLHSRRSWTYTSPMISGLYSIGHTYMEYMASYPVVLKSEDEVDEFTEDSAIYYLALEGGPTQDYMFKQQFYYCVLEYVNNVKNNLQYPDMPLQVLQGIDMEMQTVALDLAEFYRRCASHGKLLR